LLTLSGVQAVGAIGVIIPVNWNVIDDSQTANWQNIANEQTPGWSTIQNDQTAGWALIDNTP
jgi:hypothetical protein